MIIGERLRALREQRNMSQGDVEKRTGLLRCYLSRVENGHTIPAIETLEKLARALDMPLYQMLYDGDDPPHADDSAAWAKGAGGTSWGSSGKDMRFMKKLRVLLSKMKDEDRELLLFTVQQMVRRKKPQGQTQEAPNAAAATAAAS
jgi:transcriptional regulator with XRE-family HTH domain